MKKAVFFDIDGTLCDREMKISDSTKEAIRLLKKNGTYVFLCTGRTLSYIVNEELLSLEFDGLVAGCGTWVSFGEEELVYEMIEPGLMKHLLEVLEEYGLPVILEGKYDQYLEEEEFLDDPILPLLKRDTANGVVSIHEHDMKWEASKCSAVIKDRDYVKALEEISPWFEFLFHGDEFVEIVPRGFSKATGIQAVCQRLGILHENTYAFGDSTNDLEMLKYVAHGIAMGNGMEEAKEVADYVTDDIHQDGIYNACKHFALF